MKKFKYAIFDMDGTLMESMDAWKNIGREYLEAMNITVPNDLNEIIASMSVEESAEYFQSTFKINLSVEDIISGVKDLMEDKYRNNLILKPYVKEYLQKLKNENVNMCIATATPLKLANLALERNDILSYFDFVCSCDDVGVGKNQPDIYYYAANKLGGTPTETVVYEDADFALITAKEAGFYTVGVYDDFFKEKIDNIKLISDVYIESFKELI